eukprot:c17146_g1_i2.p1 GENE.c17146_g1_i2~~c17146_g1_i2.p1  ORF type:complete len:192 (-),score=72.68 c17146_g1_i2:41-616(-)
MNQVSFVKISIDKFVCAEDGSFILYLLSTSGIVQGRPVVSVLRRYNNFVALKTQLELEWGKPLPQLPSRYSFTAIFNRFQEDFLRQRRSELEYWINTVFEMKEANQQTLIQFLVQEPEYEFVLDFSSKEKLEVVVKNTGGIRLYREEQIKSPRTPWIPSESVLKQQLLTLTPKKQPEPDGEFAVPMSKFTS